MFNTKEILLMKKTLFVFALLLFVLSVIPAVIAQDDPTPEPVTRADADLVIWTDSNYTDALQTLADSFGQEFGVTVAVQEYSFGDIDTVIPVAEPAGQGPDIFMGPHDKIGALVSGGLISPVEIANPDSFIPATIAAFNYNGEIYGLPFTLENVAFFRNVDIVPDAPATWDDVLAISQEISADNDDNFETNKYGFVRMEGDAYHFFPIQSAFGGYVFGRNEDGSYNPMDVGIDSEGSLAAAEFWNNYVAEGLNPPAVDWDTMHTMFESGQSAMTITGPWALDRLRESGVNYAISDLPAGTEAGSPFLGVWGFYVSSFSEQQLLAGIFLNEYVATDEGMLSLYEANKRGPAWLATAESVDDPDLLAFTEAGANGQAMPAIPEMGQVWSAWEGAIILVAQQAEDPVKAFTDAANQIRTLIEEAAQS